MDRENIEEILKSLGSQDIPADVHQIAEVTSQKFTETSTKPKPNILWRDIMKSQIAKLAAAAVIIIVSVVGIHHIVGSGFVLADVLDRVEQVGAFVYRTKMTMTGATMMPGMPAGDMEMEATVTISNDYGMKMEMTMTGGGTGPKEMVQQMYILPEQKAAFMIMPELKKYTRMEFDDDLLARMKKQNNDPREMIKQIMSCEYTKLGCSTIDGAEVEGFQTTDSAFAGGAMEDVKLTLWVDVENRLPVRAEMDFKVNEQTRMQGVIYDYQWDLQVDASEFEPVIPEDFTGFPADGMKMPSITEEAAIEGLKFFADISGKYPKKLNLVNLMQEFEAIAKSGLTEIGVELKDKPDQTTENQHIKKAMEMMRPVQSLGMFYMTLVQDKKDPAYYGESVDPDDADAVLMRWKVSDSQYRVIFGDLTAENVRPEELSELEKAQLQEPVQ